ncbi:MAG TPA: GNAT family protein [Solirubrobacterales bacterium]|nr:GNAT family protein [Solirubrobacterales bacterium]
MTAGLLVRPMRLDEVDVRIDYFHDASDEYLLHLGVDRALLPDRDAWRAYYEQDFARPLPERDTYNLVWELDGRVVGFSSVDNIDFGEQAFMHLHIVEEPRRRRGLGAQFVRLSVAEYFRALELKRLFCQPNAFNVAPNRTLQRAGFRYVFTKEMQPSPINFPQPLTRWVVEGDGGRGPSTPLRCAGAASWAPHGGPGRL